MSIRISIHTLAPSSPTQHLLSNCGASVLTAGTVTQSLFVAEAHGTDQGQISDFWRQARAATRQGQFWGKPEKGNLRAGA